ncbi:Mitochondrial 37S ribosomal protein S27 [Zancudomyces culisetae]|uniref:Small ribosomal subunit protein mS33 n=1 Tax=Zancudomyces culisetae TaxID=1213189 RepID=A0A1R1PXA1_ZANCU|nr:Mitochondrial 37S ribosomal protein S27 [Zancudomyces culisetae]|eukprot:OMH85615.1 Mitochondrial 37S ribosomal protein S27 [Zancudomyces culisetae]
MNAAIKAKKLEIAKLSAKIFGNFFNPTNARSGGRILRKKPYGSKIGSYYLTPEEIQYARIRNFKALFKDSDSKPVDYLEIERLNRVEQMKKRGKGAPRKKTESEPKKGKK